MEKNYEIRKGYYGKMGQPCFSLGKLEGYPVLSRQERRELGETILEVSRGNIDNFKECFQIEQFGASKLDGPNRRNGEYYVSSILEETFKKGSVVCAHGDPFVSQQCDVNIYLKVDGLINPYESCLPVIQIPFLFGAIIFELLGEGDRLKICRLVSEVSRLSDSENFIWQWRLCYMWERYKKLR